MNDGKSGTSRKIEVPATSGFENPRDPDMLRRTMNILEKNLLILASAGSGKTFQLGNRVIGLVARGVAPEKIVALTFTRKAAGEFADSVLTKLAKAASEDGAAAGLREELALPDADFAESLERVIRALPRLTLGTMDSFFAKVVRGFQYELGLTGGKFDLLEGPRAVAATDEILADILGNALEEQSGDEFLHAFRRARLRGKLAKPLPGCARLGVGAGGAGRGAVGGLGGEQA
jgi:ATP-dependent exoDNAse (exonuclease V) beta subunit